VCGFVGARERSNQSPARPLGLDNNVEFIGLIPDADVARILSTVRTSVSIPTRLDGLLDA
jgi:hypothetical protein